MYKLTPLLVAFFVSLSAFNIGMASAECCAKPDPAVCKDGTPITPCCGYGPCNIFCCNCDGGCRHQKFGLKYDQVNFIETPEEAVENENKCKFAFMKADLNGDGKMTFAEWIEPKMQVHRDEYAKQWALYDTKGAGYLTEHEAYSRKV